MMGVVPYNPNMTLAEYEKDVILQSFRFHRGNRQKTANALGVTVKTLYNKLKSYQETKDEVGEATPEELKEKK